MIEHDRSERSIFLEALDVASPEGRGSFVAAACGGDAGLRERVEGLLRAHVRPRRLLDDPGLMVADDWMPAEREGSRIGPYRLVERIDEGGMGVVYLAEQTAPVRRQVALKVIKPGMDTRQVVARFEAERQTLALMDHPNIARVLDGGATESGRPYFVMELVRGLPITAYCDRERLPIRERLELFVIVCRAVQHAHQKGVIHRDLKPSNVLVTEVDGAPVPKVIDFGVAKAIGGGLTDATIHTGFHQMVGTPLYMSPEQADVSGVDVDTRSDVYALGVLLYELLTGATPFDRETFRTAALDEVRRILREVEPPTPSTRLGALGATRTTISANRRSDVRQLDRTVRGELDWIVMKALEKDRRRRYETANGLAADVTRYLTDQPVQACPPSFLYQFAKFSRRHRAVLATAAVVAFALLAGITISVHQAVRASAAEARTAGALALAERHLDLTRQAVDELYDEVVARWSDEAEHAQDSPLPPPFLEKVLPFYQRFAESGAATSAVGRANLRVGKILLQLRRGQQAGQALHRAEAVFHALIALDPGNPDHRYDLAQTYTTRSGRDGTNKAIDVLNPLCEQHPDAPQYRYLLSINIHAAGVFDWDERSPDALPFLMRAREIQERLGAEHPADVRYQSALGRTLRDIGNVYRDMEQRPDEAERYHRRAVAIHEELCTTHLTRPQFWREFAWSSGDLGRTLLAEGMYEDVPRYAGRAASVFKALGHEYPNTAIFRDFQVRSLLEVARCQFRMGERRAAAATMAEIESVEGAWEPAAEFLVWIASEIGLPSDAVDEDRAAALDLLNRSFRLRPEGNGLAWHAIGALHYRMGDLDAAIRELERASALLEDDQQFSTAFWLAMTYHRKGSDQIARAWYDRGASWMRVNDRIAGAIPDRFSQARRQLQAEAEVLLGIEPEAQ